jgi:phosphatidylinositol 4-kinase
MKSGDDLRQEQLAAQLIRVFDDVFKRNNLPLWLKPYDVVPTSAIGGWVEVVQDTVSLHILKQELGDDPSLRNYFIKAYGDKTPAFTEAQRNFTESLAAYSLICYFLQIKDRHNGNILIDREGHLVHIDYGTHKHTFIH